MHALHQSNSKELPYGCPLFLFHHSFLLRTSSTLSPPASGLAISGVCPSQKLFLHLLSRSSTSVRQNSRWAIRLAVSLCLFPCCEDANWDKTLFCCICHVLSVVFFFKEMRKVLDMRHVVEQIGTPLTSMNQCAKYFETHFYFCICSFWHSLGVFEWLRAIIRHFSNNKYS